MDAGAARGGLSCTAREGLGPPRLWLPAARYDADATSLLACVRKLASPSALPEETASACACGCATLACFELPNKCSLPSIPPFTPYDLSSALPAGTYYQPGPGPYGSRYRPGMGPGGAAALGAGAGLLGGMLLADAMTPDVVQQTTIYDGGAGGGGDWGGGGGGDLNSFNDFSGGDYGGGF